MKSLSLLLVILLAAGLTFSQSFQVMNLGMVGGTDTLIVGQVGYQLESYAHIKNISGTTKTNVRWKFNVISMVSGNQPRICFGGYCYAYFDSVPSPTTPWTIAAGATDGTFIGYMNDASMSLQNDTIRYTVYDYDNPSDNASWVVIYSFTTGINEVATVPKNTLVSVFPDPSDNASMINYVLAKDVKSAKINVMNMIGNKVAEYTIDTKETKFNIPTNNLNSGVYFYSLEVDGRVTSTKKLMVNH